MTLQMKIDTSKLQPAFLRATFAMKRRLRVVMMQGVEEVMTEANIIVPRRTGNLANSRYVDFKETRVNITISFGFSAPYAEVVHRLHRTKPRFLARPWSRRQRAIVRKMRLALRPGGRA